MISSNSLQPPAMSAPPFPFTPHPLPLTTIKSNLKPPHSLSLDASHMLRATHLADLSAGHTSPHPNFGCVIAKGDTILGEGYLYGQGTRPAEAIAAEAARDEGKGATAYLNLESGDCDGDEAAARAILQSGVGRVVVGIRHPLEHLRGKAIRAMRSEGIKVDVLGEDVQSKVIEEALKSCCLVNAPLLFRAAHRVPFSVLKYAMTLDDPLLTARHGGGHVPVRIVMSQSLDLPEKANLWNVADVPTIVATQRGACKNFQKFLASKGVEVVEFDILNPRDVMHYFHDRGYLSVLWECGGSLAAAAISSSVIHKVYAFVAPKIIGGKGAPSPVGELGMVQMTQALDLLDVCYEQIGPDMLISGYLQPVPEPTPAIPSMDETCAIDPTFMPYESKIIFFYKTWDPYGALSNFSPHPIEILDESGSYSTWPSVEHYYQAHKFVGVEDLAALECVENIKSARSPEEAARIGRRMQRQHPDLIRPDWDNVKIDVMYSALKCKFSTYTHLNTMLLSTAGSALVEASPHDLFWGGGREGEGLNYLGRLLMQLRSDLLGEASSSSETSCLAF